MRALASSYLSVHFGFMHPVYTLPAHTLPRMICPPFYSAQFATAFNQSLSFDTSGVTDKSGMSDMFAADTTSTLKVLSARALAGPSFQSAPPPCMPLPPPPHPTPSRLSRPTSYAIFLTWQSTYDLSDANKLLIHCAWADTSAFASAGYGSSWAPGNCA